jgi:hypothetical protein
MTKNIAISQIHIERVFTVLQQQGTRYRLDEIGRLCKDLTCDQVFLAVDHLTRSGQVCLTWDCNGTYWVNV